MLTFSKIFKTFVETNNLRKQLIEVAKKNEKENDIGKMFMAILYHFNSQLKINLKDEMYSIFRIKKMKTITVSQRSQFLTKLFKIRKPEYIKKMHKISNVMKLNIRNEDNSPLGTIQNVFKNTFEKNTKRKRKNNINSKNH